MKLSTRGRYGIRLMVELAQHYGKGSLSMSAISKNQDIPVKYLEQLIIPLKKANLVTSVRGPKGGHLLSKAPETINMWDILLLLESNISVVDCVNDASVCKNADDCLVRPVWGKAFEAMMKIFYNTSLKDIIDQPNKDTLEKTEQ